MTVVNPARRTTGARWCFGAALVTLPWVGVGVARLLTGRDLGAGLQPSWVLLALATILALPGLCRPCSRWPRRWLFVAAVCLAALALSGLGMRVAPPPVTSGEAWLRYFKQMAQLGIMATFLVWPAVWVRGQQRWRWVARLVVIGAVGQALYGLLQFVDWYRPGTLLPVLEQVFTSNPAILSGSEQLHVGDGFRNVPRLRGTVCEPLYLGNFLLGALPLVVVTGWRRLWRLAALATLGGLLVLTWSRGAWLAGLGALSLALVTGGGFGVGKVRGRPAWFLGAVTFLAVGLVLVGPGPFELFRERILQSFSTRDWSNLTRLYSMQAAWQAFKLSPLVGIGWGQFGWHFPVLVDVAGLQSQFTWPVVNNFPLQILCETGLLGFGVFLAAVVAMLVRACRLLGNPAYPPERRLHLRAALLGTCGVWLQLLTFSQYNLPHIWLMPGLLLAALADDTAVAADGQEAT